MEFFKSTKCIALGLPYFVISKTSRYFAKVQ